MDTVSNLGILVIILAALPPIIDRLRFGRILWDSPLYIPCAMVGLFFGFRAFTVTGQEAYGLFQNLTGQTNPEGMMTEALVYAACSLVAITIGYHAALNKLPRRTPISMEVSLRRREGMARIQIIGLLVLTLVFGALSAYGERRLMSAGYVNTSAYIYMLPFSLIGLVVLWAAFFLRNIPSFRRDHFLSIPYLLIIGIIIFYYWVSFSEQGRFKIVAPATAIGVLMFRFNPFSKKFTSMLVLGAFSAFTFFAIAGGWRTYQEKLAQGKTYSFEDLMHASFERLQRAEDFNGLEAQCQLMTIFQGPEDYLWGKSYAAVLWHPIPRLMLEKLGIEKPMTLGIHLKGVILGDSNRLVEEIDRNRTLGFSATWIGQNYENFGMVGGVMFSVLIGVGLAKVYKFVMKRGASLNIQCLYAVFIGSMPGFSRGGAIAIDMAPAFMSTVPILAVILGYYFFAKGTVGLRVPSPVFRPGSDVPEYPTLGIGPDGSPLPPSPLPPMGPGAALPHHQAYRRPAVQRDLPPRQFAPPPANRFVIQKKAK